MDKELFYLRIKLAAEALGVIVHWGKDVHAGDYYLAMRNGPVKFLQCKSVNYESGLVVPTTPDYSYDIEECVPVSVLS